MTAAQPAAKKTVSTQNQVADVRIEVPYQLSDKTIYNIPAVCTCCLSPTDNKVTVKWGSSRKYSSGGQRVTESHTATLDFCVCPDCAAHEQEFKIKQSRMIIISILVSAILSTALIYVFNDMIDMLFGGSELLFLLIVIGLVPTIIALPVLATLDIILPQRVLDHRHASRTAGVRMLGPHHFEFDNQAYAQLFSKMNGEGAQFTDMIGKKHDLPYKSTLLIKNPTFTYKIHGKSLLEGNPLVKILGTTASISAGLTLLFSLALFAMTEPPFAGSPGSYICSGVLLIVVISAAIEEWKKR